MADDPTTKPAERDPWDFHLPWINPKKMKLPFAQAPLPPAMLEGIGQVGVLQGMFEQRFDQTLIALMGKNGSPDNDWRRLRGKKRRSRLRLEIERAFPDEPGILRFVGTLLADAARLADQRHTLLHGRISFMTRTRDGVRGVAVIAETENPDSGTVVRVDLDADGLETLTHEFSHLLGRIDLLADPGKTSLLTSHERQLLLDYWGTDRPKIPTPSMQQAPPQSSGA